MFLNEYKIGLKMLVFVFKLLIENSKPRKYVLMFKITRIYCSVIDHNSHIVESISTLFCSTASDSPQISTLKLGLSVLFD
jgi:hypothetical protein